VLLAALSSVGLALASVASGAFFCRTGFSREALWGGPDFSRASALLQWIRATSETCGTRESVGAGLLAKAVCQFRRCHRLIFFAGKRAPTVDPCRLRNLRHTPTCRSRLAGERGVSVSAMSPSDIFREQTRSVIRATSETCGTRESVGAGLLANAVCQFRRCHRLIFFAGKRGPAESPATAECVYR
jgi:hypothetical protein